MEVISRVIVSKVFDTGSTTPVDVIVETYDTGYVVERRRPVSCVVLEVTRGTFAADGTDYAEVVARVLDPWETELQGTSVYLTQAGEVTFVVGLTETPETLDSNGRATFRLSTTVVGPYTIRATMTSYGEAVATVEAVIA